MHAVLYRALKHAVSLQLLPRNVAAAVRPPRPDRRGMAAVDVKVAGALLEASRGTRLYLPVLLAISTGMRRGEILGLRWSDLDLERGTAQIQQTLVAARSGHRFAGPKSAKGRRRLALPAPAVLELQAHRTQQERGVSWELSTRTTTW